MAQRIAAAPAPEWPAGCGLADVPGNGHGRELGKEQNKEQNKEQSGAVVWFTGLSGAGKTSLAQALAALLQERGVRCRVLDGDELRRDLSADLGYGAAERSEHVRRVGELAGQLAATGMVVLAAVIAPYRQDRARLRARLAPHPFLEVYCACPLDACERRDVKGLYRQARAGTLADFTGVSAPYEVPLAPDCVVDTATRSLEQGAAQVLALLEAAGIALRPSCAPRP